MRRSRSGIFSQRETGNQARARSPDPQLLDFSTPLGPLLPHWARLFS